MEINYFAVLAVGIASMVTGSFWYGPMFGKFWVKLMGWTPEQMEEGKKKGMTKAYALNLLAALLSGYVLARFVGAWGVVDVLGAFKLAFLIWLGFVASTMIGSVLWEGRPWKLYFLNVGYHLINLFVAASILALWK